MTYIQIIQACKSNSPRDLGIILSQPQIQNIINKKDVDGKTAVYYASEKGHNACLQLLIDYGADLNVQDDLGNTPLMRAVNGSHIECIRQLLENGADPSLLNNWVGADKRVIITIIHSMR